VFSGIGIWEILIILFITLLVVGPEKIPDVARALGKGLREAKRATNYFRDVFTLEEEPEYVQRQQESLREHERRMQQRGGGGPVDQPMEDWEREQAGHDQHPIQNVERPSRPEAVPILIDPIRGRHEFESIELGPAAYEEACARIELSARRVRSWS
jgi:TatA/E family protein of Tat protein translocase